MGKQELFREPLIWPESIESNTYVMIHGEVYIYIYITYRIKLSFCMLNLGKTFFDVKPFKYFIPEDSILHVEKYQIIIDILEILV